MELLEYTGPLHNPNDMPEGPIKQAYISYREQRTRCYNKKREKYKNYGAKGIIVEYSSRQFIAWWLINIKKFKGKDPTISRIDHSKNYSFDNIFIQSRSENSSERNLRVPSYCKPIPVSVYFKNLNKIGSFKSINAAAKFVGLHPKLVSSLCKKRVDEQLRLGDFYFLKDAPL